jgi:hypothetical protein
VCPFDSFSILNIGSSLFINSSSVAGFENLRSCGIRVCMTSAIYKQLKKNGRHRFLVVRFRQMTRTQPIA